MALTPFVLHVLLAGAILALGGASLRLASLMAPSGLERVLAWAVLLASTAVLEALALGLAGLGGTSAALTAAAVLTWLAVRRWVPRPEVPVSGELVSWWSGAGPVTRAGVGALAGAVLALIAISLRRPAPGFDGITYHLPEIVGFVQGGHPGAVLHPYYGLPVGNYPLTNEVLLAWGAGISHGFAPLTLWSPVSILLLIAAGWSGLRRLGIPAVTRVLALGALVLGPLLIDAAATPGTDLPALAWLACCAALCLAAPVRPVLLVPAILALGLAVGTKTTPAPLGLIVIGVAVWRCRARLAAIGWPLGAAVLAASVAGGTWYVRNLIEHGSPLWPFVAAPGGDPVPQGVQLVSHTMLERLQVTLLDHLGPYVTGVSGSTVLLVGGVLVPVLTLRRRPLLAAAAAAFGALAWANAPVTGRPDLPALFPATATSVRYLLPVFAAGALALALAASDGPRRLRVLPLVALVAAAVWGLVDDVKHHFGLPFSSWLLAGALAGGLLGALGHSGRWAARLDQALRRQAGLSAVSSAVRFTGVPAAAAAALALAASSHGFMARHALVAYEWDATVAGFLAHQHGFGEGRVPVATAPVALGPLAGDRMLHPLAVIGEHESCPQVRARTRAGWVVVRVVVPQPVPGHPGQHYPVEGTAQGCLAGATPRFADGAYRVYGPA
jgi:hypothetical protein